MPQLPQPVLQFPLPKAGIRAYTSAMTDHPLAIAPRMTPAPAPGFADHKLGVILVFGSALVWSFGGTIARYLGADDSWAVVFWRSLWAAAFLLAFMGVRDGPRGTLALFRNMGLPGIAVGLCFATASTSFIVALAHTTVANILLMQAGVPLIAALMGWTAFREAVLPATWVAIAAVIAGVAVMVSDSFSGQVSPVGDALALLIAVMFATATVITRRYAEVRMTPACCLGTLISVCVAAVLAGSLSVSAADMGLLFAFGALNLGLGMALFVTGVRLLPSSIAALIGTVEPVLGPIWVWLMHGETPTTRTIVGGAIVLAALFGHLAWQIGRSRR